MVKGTVAKRLQVGVELGEMRLTSLLEMPDPAPSACTRSSPLRVDTPCT